MEIGQRQAGGRFEEGFETADLAAAKNLVDRLS
jgi:hypothetical protein